MTVIKNTLAKIHPFMNNDFRYLMQSAYFETDGSRKGELNIIKTKLNKKLLTLFLGYDPENFENLISRKYWEVGIILSSKYIFLLISVPMIFDRGLLMSVLSKKI